MLNEEFATAQRIKSRENRSSVLTAITSAIQFLKSLKTLPKNGVCLFCGLVDTDDNKKRHMNIKIEPLKPVTKFMYLCDSRFHVEVCR